MVDHVGVEASGTGVVEGVELAAEDGRGGDAGVVREEVEGVGALLADAE